MTAEIKLSSLESLAIKKADAVFVGPLDHVMSEKARSQGTLSLWVKANSFKSHLFSH